MPQDILNLIQNHASQDPEQAELLQKALQGREAFDYLTGNKKKEVETFYDKHPIQATLQDTINKLPGMAALGIGANTAYRGYKQHSLKSKFNKQKETYKQDKGFSPSEPNSPELEGLKKRNPGMYEHFDMLERQKPKLQGLKDDELIHFLASVHPKDMEGKDNKLDLAEAVEHLTRKGLHRPQELEPNSVNDLLNNPVKHTPPHGKSFDIAEHTIEHTKAPAWKKLLSGARVLGDTKFNRGAAIAGGVGFGLAPLINLVQKHYYGEPQIQEWLKNKRQTEGKFE